MSLTPRQEEFIEHYEACLNAAEAARRAGLKNPRVYGPRLLRNEEVRRAIFFRHQARKKKHDLSIELFTEQLYYLVTRDVREFFDENDEPLMPKELSKSAAATVDSFKTYLDRRGNRVVEYHLNNKLASLDLLAKHKGLIAAVKHEVTAQVKMQLDYEKLYQRPKTVIDVTNDPVEAVIANPRLEFEKVDMTTPWAGSLGGDGRQYDSMGNVIPPETGDGGEYHIDDLLDNEEDEP